MQLIFDRPAAVNRDGELSPGELLAQDVEARLAAVRAIADRIADRAPDSRADGDGDHVDERVGDLAPSRVGRWGEKVS